MDKRKNKKMTADERERQKQEEYWQQIAEEERMRRQKPNQAHSRILSE